MDIKKLKRSLGLPMEIIKEALLLSGGEDNRFYKTLYGVMDNWAEKKRNNPTKFPVFGAYVRDQKGVVVPLLTETKTTQTHKVLSEFATELAASIVDGMPVEDDINELLSAHICRFGENITVGNVYHFNEDDNTVIGIAGSYLNRSLALVTLDGIEGESARNLANLIALNALYYYPLFEEYYGKDKLYCNGKLLSEAKREFINSLRLQKVIFPEELGRSYYYITANSKRNFHVVDDLLILYAKKHHSKVASITDFVVFSQK